jgi:hypothetical protein
LFYIVDQMPRQYKRNPGQAKTPAPQKVYYRFFSSNTVTLMGATRSSPLPR